MVSKDAIELSKKAGVIISIAAIEIVLFVLIAQHLYPNYSLNDNYISDLGVGSTAIIFNTAIQLFGLILIVGAYYLYKSGRKYSGLGFILTGLGGIGVGTFPETTGAPHIISAFITFGSIAVIALCYGRVFKKPLAYYSIAAGLLGIVVLSLSVMSMIGSPVNLGLGHGGVEEILFYDELIWALILGISLFTKKI